MFSRSVLFVVVILCLSSSLSAQSPYDVNSPPPAGFNRGEAQKDTETHLAKLIRINTENPPGNEREAAEYVASIVSVIPGVETHILDMAEGRAQLVARLRASSPTKKAVLVLAHMDVVGAEASKWSTPPFEPTIRDGYLYGRGTIDDKGMLAATVAALRQLSRVRGALDRDIILVATADEENGPEGVARLLNRHFDLLKDVEFALNEGGRIRIQDGRVHTVNIQTTEKIPYNVTAAARGTSGHGSVPLPDNALAALSRAVGRVAAWRAPARLNPTTRLYFAGLAEIEKDAEVKQAMESISSSTDPQIIEQAAEVLSREPLHNAVLRSGQSLTLIKGGFRSNVIPSEGTANFNVRVLPADDVHEIVREMNRVGGESQVRFELKGELQAAAPASPVANDLFHALETAAKVMAPEALVIPFMSTGATNSALLRAKGIPTYGILPMPLPVGDELRMHGDDERVPLQALGWASEYLYRTLWLVAKK